MSQFTGLSIAAVVIAAGIAVPFWWLTSVPPGLTPDTPELPTLGEPDDKKSGFAAGADGGAAAVKFDGERAVRYARTLCDIGPRVSGSPGMKRQQEILEKHFKDHGATVVRQEFKGKQFSRREATPMTNLVVTWHPEKTRRILICAHYDTRPIADQEENRANWNKPFVSANDGTAGVAWMMELAHHMKDFKPAFGVDFLIVDGEEYVFETPRTGGGDKYFFGSEYFAEDYMRTRAARKYKYDAGVVLDLAHAKDAKLKVEAHSYDAAPTIVDQIWGVAKDLGAKSFLYERGHEVLDDHIALIRAGIPTVDVIDFDYPHWHKLSDTVDKLSADQMSEVAKVLTTWIGKIK